MARPRRRCRQGRRLCPAFHRHRHAELKGLAGHRGAWLLRREVDGGAEFIALTLWESRQSIEAFTGPDISKSVVEPEARAVLSAFDDFASHYDVAFTGMK